MRRFPLVQARRGVRGAWRHFLGFFACITLGVAALTAVGTLAANVDRALSREARTLMGGDLELRAMRPPDADTEAAVARLVAAGAVASRVQELVGMAVAAGGAPSLLVELKAVDAAYPLYGGVETAPARPLAALLAGDGIVVHESLLERLGVRVGEPVSIGEARVTVRGVLVSEPDGTAGFTLGPRVFLSAETLARTGLVQVGSRVRHRALVRLPDGMAARDAREEVARQLVDPGVRVTAFNEAQPGLRRFFDQMATYLGLVGLVSLLVGAVGVVSAVTTFVRRERVTIAVLKCLGAGSRVLLATYLVQTQAVAVAGSVAGVVLGTGAQPLLVGALAGMLPVELGARPDPATIARGLAMGVLAALLATLWPLLEIRAVRPSLLLRREVEPPPRALAAGGGRGRAIAAGGGRRERLLAALGRGRDRVLASWGGGHDRVLAALVIGAGLAGLAVWQAGSLKLGAIFAGAALAALALLALLARALTRLVRALPRRRGLAWRQGLANLTRPGGQTVGVVVALGIGVMLLVAVALLEASLARQIDAEQRRDAPSFFFVDIQPDQREAFERAVASASGGETPALTPVVRGRLAAVDGVPVTRAMIDARRGGPDGEPSWYLRREYVLTWAEVPPAGNVILAGRWWTAADGGRPLVSVEEAAARHLGVGTGARLTFDIQGVLVDAEVASIRRVDWQSLGTNFFLILSPGALDGAPATYVATARVPAAAEAATQAAVTAAFPNVTAIPVRDVLARVSRVLDQMALAIRVMALFSIGAGLVVMVSALTATRYARLAESVIWRALGATRGIVARIFAVEYACLGAAAGLGGTALAALLSWIVLRFLLEVPWTPAPGALALGVSLTVAGSLAVGFLATFRLLGQKPLSVLRQE